MKSHHPDSMVEDIRDTDFPWSNGKIDSKSSDVEKELSELIGDCFTGLANVPKSHAIKRRIAEILGYETKEKSPRSKEWSSVKPFTFAPHSLLVKMVGVQNNLQIWGKEAGIFGDGKNKIAIILLDDNDCVRDVVVVEASVVEEWDGTGTITVKFKGTINRRAHDLIERSDVVNNTQLEIIPALRTLIGHEITASDVRTQGEEVSALVADAFGQEWEENGQFPDIEVVIERISQGLEIKSQRDNVVDFASHHPQSGTPTESGYAPMDVVYVVVVITDGVISGILCSRGEDLTSVGVSVSSSVQGKSQRRVPKHLFNRTD